jgi:hypothetical protein
MPHSVEDGPRRKQRMSTEMSSYLTASVRQPGQPIRTGRVSQTNA